MDPNEYEVLPTGMDDSGDASGRHNTSYGFCTSDDFCPCHEDADLIADVNADYQAGLLSPEDAANITGGRTF